MTDTQLQNPPHSSAAIPFVDRSLIDRTWRGAAAGLGLAVIVAVVDVILADWDLGLVFNKLSPPGIPIGYAMRLTLLGLPMWSVRCYAEPALSHPSGCRAGRAGYRASDPRPRISNHSELAAP